MNRTTLFTPSAEIMDFRAYEAAPGISVVVLPDAPFYTHVAVSHDFLRTTGLKKEDVIGRGHFEMFPKSPDDPNFTGEQNLRASFEDIIKHKVPHEIPVQRYDIPREDGTFLHKYWKINNAPILSDTGEVLYIIHTALDITDQVVATNKVDASKGMERAYAFFMSAPVIIGYVRGTDYIIELANEGLLEVWGRSKEIIGQPLFSALPELEGQGFRALLDRVCATGEPFYAYEYPITLSREGKEEVLYFDFIYKPFYEDGASSGRAAGIISVGLDVTEKVLTRQRIKNVVEQAVDPILILKGESMVLDMANEALLKVWNVDHSVIGKTFLEILPEMKNQGFLELLQGVYRSGEPFQGYEVPAVFQTKNGETRTVYFNFTYQPYREADGSITGVLVLARDVTENLLAKQKLQESEAELTRFKFMVENAQDSVFLIREDGSFAYLNRKAIDLLGYSEEELLKMKVQDIDPYYDEAKFAEAFALSQRVKDARIETYHQRKDGYIYPVEINLANFTYHGTAYMFAIGRDITDRKQFETSLKKSNDKWQQLANVMPVIVWTGEADGRLNFMNNRWYEFTGMTEAASVDFGWTSVLHPDDVDRCLAAWSYARKNGVLYEISLRYRSKAGDYRWVLARGVPIKDENDQIVAWFGTSTDIHEQITLSESLEQRVRERTLELENQHLLLDNILKNSSNGISVSKVFRDESGKVVDALTILANDGAVTHMGLPKEVILTKRATEIEPQVMGSPYYLACVRTLETGEPFIMQYQMQATGRWLELTVSRLDKDHLIQIFTDVTLIKEAQLQLEKSVEDLKRSNANLEDFAYAASHDLKEPIRKIHFFSDRLKGELEGTLTGDQMLYFNRLENATRRMGSLIDDLLAYSQATKGKGDEEEVDLGKKVQLVLEDLEVEVQQKGASIEVGALPVIRGSKRQLQQLFQNLVSNALKYSKPGIPPLVQITSEKAVGKKVKPDLSLEEGRKLFHLIEVKDNGIGFPQEDALRIFNVFTRLHGNAEYRGTGVGLSIVQKVVQNHGGHIWAESNPGNGAAFRILFPAE